MATVKISDGLRTRVLAGIRGIYSGELAAASEIAASAGDQLYDLLLGKYKELLKDVEPAFLNFEEKLSVAGVHARMDDRVELRGYDAAIMPLSRPMPWPINQKAGWPGLRAAKPTFSWDTRVSANSITLVVHPALTEFISDLNTRQDKIDTVRGKIDTLLRGVERLFSTYSTLNAAVKAWPPLRDLLQPDIRARLEEKVERTRTSVGEVAINPIDTSNMTQLITAKKLSGGL
jgi:hypothetical protein